MYPLAFTSLIDQGLHLGLADAVCHVLEKTGHEFQVGQLPDKAEAKVADFLHDLTKMLKEHSSLEVSLTSGLKAFEETVFRYGLLHTMPVYPKKQVEVSEYVPPLGFCLIRNDCSPLQSPPDETPHLRAGAKVATGLLKYETD